MNGHHFTLGGADLVALNSGALYWPAQSLLCVSDLHLGKSGRRGRLGEATLPPYETRDTLIRLTDVIEATSPRAVICLGDSFDDAVAADELAETDLSTLATLQAGRRWLWIEGNHDPGGLGPGGSHVAAYELGPLRFCHVACPDHTGEISGHYHPKATLRVKGRHISRPAFLVDKSRVILPAFGTYTGGLRTTNPALSQLMAPDAVAIMTGAVAVAMPMQRR